LFGSSINVWRAARIIEDQDIGSARFWLAAAIVLGGIFILRQSNEGCLADEYSFNAHIVQHHFLIALILPPLLLRGIPRQWGKAGKRRRLESIYD
jgi:heme/copper-type cytochrome/quinol oxidase subunit 3